MNSENHNIPTITVDGSDNRSEKFRDSSYRRGSAGSRLSIASSFNSIFTSTTISNDEELKHVAEKPVKENRFKKLLHRKKDPSVETEEDRYRGNIKEKLEVVYRLTMGDGVLRLQWDEIFEINVFGGSMEHLVQQSNFSRERNGTIPFNDVLMNWLANARNEYGDYIFRACEVDAINLHPSKLRQTFQGVLQDLRNFEDIISLYSNENNHKNIELFEIFRNFIDSCVLVIPLALTMFGNYLLSYHNSNKSNYDNEEILKHFWKAARTSYAIRFLHGKGYFDKVLETFEGNDLILLNQYFVKNNDFALSLSLFSIGEYYQFHHDLNSAVDMWEISSHLTKDPDSCQMAVWGLTDGFGTGNHIKSLNKLGKKSKRNKFNTKRRIAQVYRLNKNEDLGTSWVWKTKYD